MNCGLTDKGDDCMRCDEIIRILEKKAPVEYAMDWDHVGLLVGRRNKEVCRLLLAVDVTNDVIRQAIDQKADMIVSHHPMIFGRVDRVNDETVLGRKILDLVEHGICCYAMHTNFDTIGGMAKEAAKLLGIQNLEVLEETKDGEGIGQIGQLQHTQTIGELAAVVKKKFDLKNVIIYGDTDKKVDKVAICPGSGRSVIDIAAQKEADCLITGDIGHHEGLDSCELGVTVIDASHYGLEQIFMYIMRDYIKGYNPDMEIMIADAGVPFTIV